MGYCTELLQSIMGISCSWKKKNEFAQILEGSIIIITLAQSWPLDLLTSWPISLQSWPSDVISLCLCVSSYHHPRLEEQVVHGLCDVGGVDQVVVGVFIFAVSHFQSLHKRDQRWDGDLSEIRVNNSEKDHYGPQLSLPRELFSPWSGWWGRIGWGARKRWTWESGHRSSRSEQIHQKTTYPHSEKKHRNKLRNSTHAEWTIPLRVNHVFSTFISL